MLKIKIKRKYIKEEDGSKTKTDYIIVNNIVDEESFYLGPEHPSGHFYNEEVITVLKKHSFSDIGNFFTYFGFGEDADCWENKIDISIYCKEYYDLKSPSIKVNLQLQEWEHWAKPWSMSSLAKEFESNIIRLDNDRIEYWQEEPDSILNGFGVLYHTIKNTQIIKSELDYLLNIVEKAVEKTNKNLLEFLDNEVVLTYFQFPEEIKTACKQYLVYFTQFIADMGIFVDSELKEELNHTLFKITPKDKNESLEKIREALNIYLNAPNDKDFQHQISNQKDIAAMQ